MLLHIIWSSNTCRAGRSLNNLEKRLFHKCISMENSTSKWHPSNIIDGKEVDCCLVLNRKIRIPKVQAQKLWQNAHIRCTVDGGTNRWLHFLETQCQEGMQMKSPDFITGDFDSVSQEALEYFKKSGETEIIHTPDQNATDFTKAIGVLRPKLPSQKQVHDIIAFHDNSGRFDQIMANINTLHKLECSALHVYLLSCNSLTWLLRPGKHSIFIPKNLIETQRWCALVPVGAAATSVTTSGLKWNLTNDELKFGAMVSTSNTYATEHVQIETDTSLIWSMGVFKDDDDD